MIPDEELWPVVAKAKHDQKWELLKPKIEELYIGRERDLADVQEEMKARFGFLANEGAYKYRFRQWGWKRSMTSKQKTKALQAVRSRADAGKSSSVILRGKEVDKQKLRRFLKDVVRRQEAEPNLHPSVQPEYTVLSLGQGQVFGKSSFLQWNLPRDKLVALTEGLTPNIMQSPALEISPSNMQIVTPPECMATSPSGALSPLTVLQRRDEDLRRASLLFQGQSASLIRLLPKNKRNMTLNWLNQFWLFAYTTAKNWGRGPYSWSSVELNSSIMNYATPTGLGLPIQSPSNQYEQNILSRSSPHITREAMCPSLCRWSIHCSPDDLIYIDDEEFSRDPVTEPSFQDPTAPETWQEWPNAWHQPDYSQRLVQSLETNSFSTVAAKDLPVAIAPHLRAATEDNALFLEEALGFAICSGNVELVDDVTQKIEKAQIRPHRIYPLHLATSYVHGSKSCCLIVDALIQSGISGYPDSTNDIGHNVFDNLMLTILRQHSTLSPSQIDRNFRKENRFPAEEVDICGRWDADSDCYRKLGSSGIQRVPDSWKHKFCHTSTQAVSHIVTLLLDLDPRLTRADGGLLPMRCGACGCSLSLDMLYTAVLVGFLLAEHGLPGEDLFGIVTVVLSIILTDKDCVNIKYECLPLSHYRLGQDVLDETEDCEHVEMRVLEFAESVSSESIARWPSQALMGWNVLRAVLRIMSIPRDSCAGNHEERIPFPVDQSLICPKHLIYRPHLEIDAILAIFQAEYLTHRRLEESDPWVSNNFSVQRLLHSLNTGSLHISAGRITDIPLMNLPCRCGWLPSGWGMPDVQDVSATYFTNLGDKHENASYIPPPSLRTL